MIEIMVILCYNQLVVSENCVTQVIEYNDKLKKNITL